MTTLRSREGTIAAAVTVVAWAAAFPAIRAGLEGFSPWALGAARLAVASLALAAAAVVLRPARPPRRLWGRVVLAGLVGQALYQGLLMTGEVTVPAGTASILIATAPLFSVVAAALLLREPVRGVLRGMLVAFAGVALVGLSLGLGGGVAALVVLAAATCQGLYHVIVKPLAVELGAFSATAWSLWVGTVLCLPLLPLAGQQARSASPPALVALLVLGIVSSALGYATWSVALQHASIAQTTVALYLVPVVALLLAWLWLGERPTPLALAGGLLAVIGVVVVRRPRRASSTRRSTRADEATTLPHSDAGSPAS